MQTVSQNLEIITSLFHSNEENCICYSKKTEVIILTELQH